MSLSVSLLHPGTDPSSGEGELYWANITHNLGAMADAAGIFNCLWRPEEEGIFTAHQLILPLSEALEKLKKSPEYYKKFNAANGWGLYDNFVPWIEKLLVACREY